MPASDAMAEPQIPIRWICFCCDIRLFFGRPLQKAQDWCSLKVQFRCDAEGQGDVAPRDMAGAETNGDRSLEPVQHPQDDFIEQVGLLAGSHAIEHFTKYHSADPFEFSREDHLSQ